MTRPLDPPARRIPTSSLLPPSAAAPRSFFPSPSAALLGPLPPTTPLHLALNYLLVTDSEAALEGSSKVFETVLIVTGHADELRTEIEEEDEDWLRLNGGKYGMLDRLRRIDMRCCPTIDHAQLLLTTLAVTAQSAQREVSLIRSSPGLVILWNIAGLLMEPDEVDENKPYEAVADSRRGKMRFRLAKSDASETALESPHVPRKEDHGSTVLSDYMNVVAAARSTVHHFASLSTGALGPQLLILEPQLDALSALPILHPTAPTEKLSKVSTPVRRKQIFLKDALEVALGGGSVGLVEPVSNVDLADESGAHYVMSWPGSREKVGIVRRKCEKSDWASAGVAESRITGTDGIELAGETTGWRWDWIDT